MPIRQMNLSAPSVRGARRPWGRWALRGVALTWVIGMVLLPVSALVESGLRDGARAFWREVTSPIAFAALELTLLSALMMTAINMALGTLTAYVLVRYRFPGNRLLDSLIDLPFAIPTLVTGLMLVALYGPQHPPGAWFEQAGAQIIFARPGIVLALLFVTYPFVIRSVQPVLLEIDPAQEEAAWTLGASRRRTFAQIILPAIAPAILSGALLSFARALGEFGAIVIVAGNIPRSTLTAPVYIYGQIESQNQRGASAVSLVLLALSFGVRLAAEWLLGRRGRAYVAG